ncbi:thiol:disulfide interchange protein DsbG [Marinospirillum sp.]|uniref:thiol:disulfide interchange protein DsbG n=1 Tax=Marinospirillum sp. TaxID=2183934 RepID=UPI00286FCD6A|nr:thiol:disulfide interchange protein DsbG [Marinospirillum sp.]MDR9466779.1 thiol:disulfide interchange protein DsbG [Marinospirillum sp.]
MCTFARILPAAFLVGSLFFPVALSANLPAEKAPVPGVVPEAADENLSTAMEYPEPIKHLENQGLEIIRSFPVGQSLVGWVVSFEGKDLVVYTTVDGDYLINGIVLDAQGVDLTEEHQKTWLPRPEWDDLEEAHYLTEPSLYENEEGQLETRTTLYMFFDPNCPFSQLAWLALQPYREAGAQIRWVPVAYLKPDSRHRTAALLDAANPEELLALNMNNFGQPSPELDVPLETHHREQMQANMDLMQSLGINGTPGWVWMNEDEELTTHSGMPRLPRLSEITGLPEQEHPETELMRYR